MTAQELGQRITSVRDERGLTLADVAKRLGIDRDTLISIERGERMPADELLAQFAGMCGVTLHELLSPHRTRKTITKSFRLARQVGLREARTAVDTLTGLARKFVDLERVLGIERPVTPLESLETYRVSDRRPGLDPALAGEHAAATVRDALGMGAGPAVGLAERLEVEAGMRIFFLDDLPTSVAGLVIWSEELGACIGINSSHPKGRRRWSLAHEVGNFLRNRDAGNVLPTAGWTKQLDSDIFAENFTKAFLLPKMSVSKQFADRCRANGGHFTVADILWMGNLYEVTFQRITERLESFSFFPPGTYERLTNDRFRPEAEHRALRDRRKPSRFPVRYTTLALEAYEKALITERELSDYLETDRFSVRSLHQRWAFQSLGDGYEVELRLAEEVVRLT